MDILSTVYIYHLIQSNLPSGYSSLYCSSRNISRYGSTYQWQTCGFEGIDYTDIATLPPSIALNCNAYWILEDSTINEKYCTP